MIRAVDVRQKAQSSHLEDIQKHIGESHRGDNPGDSSARRLAGARMWRQKAFDGEQGEGPRAPAVVLGGWDTELDEEEVIQKAHKLLKDLSLDLDLQEASKTHHPISRDCQAGGVPQQGQR